MVLCKLLFELLLWNADEWFNDGGNGLGGANLCRSLRLDFQFSDSLSDLFTI